MNRTIEELKKRLEIETDKKSRIDLMNILAWDIRRLDSSHSLELFSEANTLASEIAYEIGYAESSLGLGIHEAYADNHEAALKRYQKVQKIFDDNNYIEGKIRVLNSIGYSNGKLGRKDKALEAYMEGLSLARDAENAPMAIFFLNNIAEIYKDIINKYDEALKYYFEAVEYCKKTDSTIYGIILSSIGECYLKLGEMDKALQYSHEGLKISKESGDKISMAYCHHTLGKVNIKANNIEKALENLKLSMSYRIESNNKFGHAEILGELGSLYLLQEDYDRAVESLTAALKLSEDINAEFLQWNIHRNMAAAYEKIKNYENSVKHYKKYIELSNRIVSNELETKISALSADSKLQQAKKDAEIYKLKNVELKAKTEEIQRKAKELEESYNNIAVISEIGQKITSSLDLETIMNTIYQSMNTLMDATVFGLGLYDEENQEVEYKIFIENSKRLPLFKASVFDEGSFAAKCIRTKQEVFYNDLSDDAGQLLPEDDESDAESKPANSLIYYPLIFGDKAIGAITVQSYKTNAYTEHNLNTLKALASYITIAITNSQKTEELKKTLNHLRETQEYLIQSEKMAALGQLISGIAHEINTPLGAIQASINNISEYMHHTIGEKLPELFSMLDKEMQQLFFSMIQGSMEKDVTISSKDERRLKKKLNEQLQEWNIEGSDTIADTLVDIGIYNGLEKYLPLFTHSKCQFIMKVCYELSGIMRNIRNMDIAVEKASKMLYALKNYAHFDRSDTPVEADIIEGIETVLALYHNHIKHGTELIRNYKKLPKIKCFPDELNQVWTNLVHNSLQAMDYKGTLEITAYQEEDYVAVRLTDTGIGIPEDIKDKIFTPFFTTKRQGEGSGLGLGIVKKIVNKHQGEIEVESTPGKTSFTVKLPMNLS
ncbi:MAG: ATP-binding protein [Bacillota bacterium]